MVFPLRKMSNKLEILSHGRIQDHALLQTLHDFTKRRAVAVLVKPHLVFHLETEFGTVCYYCK